jgi:hypothetical protein
MRVGIVGGGIFGTFLALQLASRGANVSLFESSERLLNHASRVNQARLHTGMHYPRDLPTAQEALADHDVFRNFFPTAVRRVNQHYAIANDSKISFREYLEFASRLGLEVEEVPSSGWFRDGTVEGAVKVRESTVDVDELRRLLTNELEKQPSVIVHLAEPVSQIGEGRNPFVRTTHRFEEFDFLVVATYSMVDNFAGQVGIELPPLRKQLTEVVLGYFEGLKGIGITVMDGPFWSTMPYGLSGFHSLTSVAHTPILESHFGRLDCQERHGRCGTDFLFSCGTCFFRPPSAKSLMIRQYESFLKERFRFTPRRSIYTVKSLPNDSELKQTDGRPTRIFSTPSGRISFVHSGKIGSAVRLVRDLGLDRTSLSG